MIRQELNRLLKWFKERNITLLVTSEHLKHRPFQDIIDQYLCDCVIAIEHQVLTQISTRNLRVVKYRGSNHATDEFPFLIGRTGISVTPVTSMVLDYAASEEVLSIGMPELDQMLGGGIFESSSTLIEGAPGTGKTSIACKFLLQKMKKNKKSMYIGFEESPAQIIRNMKSIGVDIGPYLESGMVKFHTVRPTSYGLETHLAVIEE